MDATDLIPRHLADEVLNALAEARIVAILGPRQTGKSTLARSLAARGFTAEFVSLDDQDTAEAARLDPRGFLERLRSPAIIDEIQRAPELMLALKARVDANRQPGQYLLTGSANLTTLPTVRDALPGRVDYLDLWPLSQGEIRGRREQFLDDLYRNDPPHVRGAGIGRKPYADLIAAGGFPDARLRSVQGRGRYFDSYLRSIFGRDVRDVSGGDPGTTEALLRLIATRSGSLANFAELGRVIGVTENTVRAHLTILENLLLVRRHSPWLANLSQRMVKSPKLYVSDTGLACHLAGVNAARLLEDADAVGWAFETFVVMELLRQSSYAASPVRIMHYRDKDRREIDVVLERSDGTVVAIEVKSRATAHTKDFRPLMWLRDRLGVRFAAGVVLNTAPDTLPFGDRLWSVPICGLWA